MPHGESKESEPRPIEARERDLLRELSEVGGIGPEPEGPDAEPAAEPGERRGDDGGGSPVADTGKPRGVG